MAHFLSHLNRDSVYRILKAEGLGRLPPADKARKPHGEFKDYEVGFVHMDVKHLPKLGDKDGSTRKRYLFVAIDRASRFVHLAVKDDETTASAVAFLDEAITALPFRVERLLTDRGSCFTADAFEKTCRRHTIEHQKTRPYTPKINGMVERFNGRIQREVLPPDVRKGIRNIVDKEPAVARPNDILTMHFGPRDVLAALSLEFEQNRPAAEIEAAVSRIEHKIKTSPPEVTRVFVEAQRGETHRRAQNALVPE